MLGHLARRFVSADTFYLMRYRLDASRGLGDLYNRHDSGHWLSQLPPDLGLIMDGFPRSANTYSRFAFLRANPDVTISTHRHSPRALEQGVRRGVPTILLIRDPVSAVASGSNFDDGLTYETLLRCWVHYHRRASRIADRLLVVRFQDAIADFGHVIELCNQRFGSSFAPYRKTDENEAAVRAETEALAALYRPELFDRVVGRPSEARTRSQEDMLATLSDHGRELLRRAVALHQRLDGLAAPGPS